jgi:hypothetical protein
MAGSPSVISLCSSNAHHAALRVPQSITAYCMRASFEESLLAEATDSSREARPHHSAVALNHDRYEPAGSRRRRGIALGGGLSCAGSERSRLTGR